MAEIKRRSVGANWTWFEDYIFLSKTWTARCPANRTVEVGTGVSVGGEPRGSKTSFSGDKEFSTWGAGAIHFRVVDGGEPCEVILYSGKATGIPILRLNTEELGETLGAPGQASRFSFAKAEQAEVVERFNKMVRELAGSASQGGDADPVAAQLEKLRHRSESLEEEFREIRAARYALRKQFARPEDLGADCDANRCRSEKKDEPITSGETDLFVHDDQDRGAVNVHCKSGEIEVIIGTAVWSTFNEYDRKRLQAGQTWKRDIASQSSWYDQTNRVEVVGKADSVYNLDFISWDD